MFLNIFGISGDMATDITNILRFDIRCCHMHVLHIYFMNIQFVIFQVTLSNVLVTNVTVDIPRRWSRFPNIYIVLQQGLVMVRMLCFVMGHFLLL